LFATRTGRRADPVFTADEREFVRRAGFAIMAWAAVHLKKEPDTTYLGWLPLIERHAGDGRNFVKKAVNWALRQIGSDRFHCTRRPSNLPNGSPPQATRPPAGSARMPSRNCPTRGRWNGWRRSGEARPGSLQFSVRPSRPYSTSRRFSVGAPEPHKARVSRFRYPCAAQARHR